MPISTTNRPWTPKGWSLPSLPWPTPSQVSTWPTGPWALDATARALLAVVGLALSPLLPLNKRVWSPSYVCLSCGLAALLQALLILLVDLWRRPAPHTAATPTGTLRPRQGTAVSLTLIFGTNPLFLYVASEAIAIVLGATGIKAAAYDGIHAIVANGYWASAAYAALFVAVHALMGYPLWRRHIYIKL